MPDEKNRELHDKATPGEAPPPQYVERRWPLKDVARVESDFALPLLASELRHARTLLQKLATTSFGWTEICLAGASLLIGAVFGVLPSDLKLEQKIIPIVFYCVFPVVGSALLVAYFFLKGKENATTRETASRLLDLLPNVPSDRTIESTSELRVQMKIDTSNYPGDINLPNLKESVGKMPEGAAGDGDYSSMSDVDLGYRCATALLHNDLETAESIDKFQRGRPEFQEAKFASRWEADFLYWKLVSNNGGSFEKLKSLAANSDLDPYICNNIASVYRWNREYELAAEWLRKGAEHAESQSEKVEFLSRAAGRLYQAGQEDAALRLYEEIGELTAQYPDLVNIRAAGAVEFFELQKQEEFEVAILEYKLQQEPTDYDARFSLAYKQAQLGRRALAAYHYTLIPFESRKAKVWNNLGVSWQALELPGSAAQAFQRSCDLGETLATSNLANMLIEAGFLVQAEALIARDVKQDHNVELDRTIVRLHEEKEKDKNKRESLLENARQEAVFFQNVGKKAISPRPPLSSGTFSDEDYTLSLVVDGHRVSGSATQVDQVNKLAAALGGTAESTPIQKFVITGTSVGAAFALELRRQEGGRISSLLAIPVKFLGFYSNDALECVDPSETNNWKPRRFVRDKTLDQVPSLGK